MKKHPLTRRRKIGSIQCRFVGVRAIQEQMLCIASSTPGKHDYVSVLQVEGISYDLKGEEEQQQLLEQYQAMLCGLAYPVQILWRTLPLNIHEYLTSFALPTSETDEHERSAESSVWKQLAASHVAFLEELAARRTLLSRKFYFILRVPGVPDRRPPSWWQRFRSRSSQEQRQALSQAQAQQELDRRVSEVGRHLEAMGLSFRRLSGLEELVPFSLSCLTPL
jgi:hypothetical protein